MLAEKLAELAPDGLDKVFLLTTGSEATECAIKLARAYGVRTGGRKKIGIVGAERGFHGRTLGAQQAGGIAGQKSWIVNEDPAIVQVPFPDGYWTEDTSFDLFIATLAKKGLEPGNVAGVTPRPVGRTARERPADRLVRRAAPEGRTGVRPRPADGAGRQGGTGQRAKARRGRMRGPRSGSPRPSRPGPESPNFRSSAALSSSSTGTARARCASAFPAGSPTGPLRWLLGWPPP